MVSLARAWLMELYYDRLRAFPMFAAIQYAKSGLAGTAVNPVRFCWWGAEEIGLLGARFYVANLTEQEAQQHLLYLNYDMLGSPNFVIQVRATVLCADVNFGLARTA